MRTAVRHRWWALLGFVVLGAPLAAVTLTTTPVYLAQTRVLVSDAPPHGRGIQRTSERCGAENNGVSMPRR